VSAEQRRLAEAGVSRARARLDRLEERLAQVERHAFADLDAIERRLEALELGLPSSRELQERRYEAICRLRAEGWSVTAIAQRTNVSRSRVGALVAALPTPEYVTGANGSSYPARRAAATRRSSLDGA
jgi:DNA-binding NarL/FixJ family response regulator